MKMTENEIKNQIEKIKRLVPEPYDPKEFLTETLLSLLKGSSPISMGITAINDRDTIRKRITDGLETAKNINDPDKIRQTAEGIVSLYTIEWILRPALPIKNGRIETLQNGIWKDVEADIFETQSASVCRIDLDYLGHLGTGFVVGENSEHYVILTNAHVIEGALNNYWRRDDQLKLRCGFAVEDSELAGPFYELTGKYFIHDVYDLGIVYLPKENIDDSLQILNVNAEQPVDFEDLKIGVIGHPSFNSNRDPFPRLFGFGDQFGIKRLSLGLAKYLQKREWRNKEVDLLLHDCTTLSGSSGSCIIDLKTKSVIGLHFGGWPHPPKRVNMNEEDVWATLFEFNGAVPSWLLSSHDFLQEVNFTKHSQ